MRSLRLGQPAAYPPRLTDATRPFWEALGDGRFVTTRCEDCGDVTFPPKVICPNCFSSRLSWQTLSGRGTLYSHTRVWAAPGVFSSEVPYTLCIVDLDEGLRVASRLLHDSEPPAPGSPVSLVFVHYEDITLFYFEPSSGEGRY